MKMSDTFRKASEKIIDKPELRQNWIKNTLCCCEAISASFSGHETRDLEFFSNIFKPKNSKCFWWENPFFSSEDQEARRLALLFAAEIAKDQGV